MANLSQIQGAGLGLKRELIPQIQACYGQTEIANISFPEIAKDLEDKIRANAKQLNEVMVAPRSEDD